MFLFGWIVLIIPMICASVKRLVLLSSALFQGWQTLHQTEGTSGGGQVTRNHPTVVHPRHAPGLVRRKPLQTGKPRFGKPKVVVGHRKLPTSGSLNHLSDRMGAPFMGPGPRREAGVGVWPWGCSTLIALVVSKPWPCMENRRFQPIPGFHLVILQLRARFPQKDAPRE